MRNKLPCSQQHNPHNPSKIHTTNSIHSKCLGISFISFSFLINKKCSRHLKIGLYFIYPCGKCRDRGCNGSSRGGTKKWYRKNSPVIRLVGLKQTVVLLINNYRKSLTFLSLTFIGYKISSCYWTVCISIQLKHKVWCQNEGGSKSIAAHIVSRFLLYTEYNGRIKESPVHFWSMFSVDRSALHCPGLLRHLSSWLHGSKKGPVAPP